MKMPNGRTTLAACAVLTSSALVVAGCGGGSGSVTTSTVTVTAPSNQTAPPTSGSTEASRDFPVSDFNGVRLTAHYDLVVNIGSPTSVRAQGDPAALDLLDIHTEGQTLVAAVKPNGQWPPNARVTVTITTPALSAAEITGSGDIRIGAIHSDALSIAQNGSGDIDAPDVTLTRIAVTSGGSGRIRVGGTAEDASLRLSGSGEADLSTLTVKRADVSISGSGSLILEALEKVSGSISGSGDVRVTGGATCSVSSSGSGKATCA
jgi:Putative auto-transporter adhesin, head GIN domain